MLLMHLYNEYLDLLEERLGIDGDKERASLIDKMILQKLREIERIREKTGLEEAPALK
jgi:hypothetical protein